ncbi:MAG: sugar ABC transporter ATP-binding protein [Azospirillaceae bacterium]|nr:sugar ABC transporter ATP-binding protein [Azospirillaceae bacterium]
MTAPPSVTSAVRVEALAVRGLVKTFGGVRALDGANLTVATGTIHGLVGQNGAGKSTLIKIIAGIYRPDAGVITIRGRPVDHLTPARVTEHGIHMIHQDRLLVPTFTVAEALFLGQEPRRGALPVIDRRALRSRAREALHRIFDIDLSPDALVGELTTAQQQIVQITRALLNQPAMLVLDEPTAALVRRDAERLLATLLRLRDQGLTILYISHYLAEIERLCDQVTVLRNGVDVGTVDPRQTSTTGLISMMIARDVGDMFPRRKAGAGAPALIAQALSQQDAFSDISLSVRHGEIVGLTGLVGSGAKELARCLFGVTTPDQGTISVDGQTLRPGDPAAAVAAGVAMVPEDRRGHGVALRLSVRENTTLAGLKRFSPFGLLNRKAEHRETDRLIRALAIRTPDGNSPVRDLSGGNQQKVVLAKWLSCQSSVFVLDEPTVGVDIGAKVEIYRLIADLAVDGAAILLVSSDLMELSGMADRILVMYRGRIAAELLSRETDADTLMRFVTTGRGGEADADAA